MLLRFFLQVKQWARLFRGLTVARISPQRGQTQRKPAENRRRLLGAREPSLLQHVVDLAVGSIPGCAVEPHVGADCTGLQVDCDQHRLVQALKSLLEYALAHGDAALSMGCVDGVARIGILAGGVPVDAESLPRLLAQPDPAPFDEGLGLRLLLARAIIEAHGGTLSATTDAAGKLRLACTLPAS